MNKNLNLLIKFDKINILKILNKFKNSEIYKLKYNYKFKINQNK